MKDAAGLGTLGYALAMGDNDVLSGSPDDKHIRIVSEAIRRPNDFWSWALSASSTGSEYSLVFSAQKAYRGGGWPWDRAFMQAAAYLALTNGVPDTRLNELSPAHVPLWVAIDKHTHEGKAALKEAARHLNIRTRDMMWISFYCEGALTNALSDSPWWEKEVDWRLSRLGLSIEQAESVWSDARPIVSGLLRNSAAELQAHLDSMTPDQQMTFLEGDIG